jgi:hemerythrin-like domain-containing protein
MKKSKAKSAAHGPKAPDAIALLKDDHKTVSGLFAQFDKLVGKSGGAKKLKLARKICRELKVHTQIEEEIFYPAVNAVLPKEQDLLDEAQVEHDGAKSLIKQLDSMEPGDDRFDAKVTVLAEYIKHHVKEEHEDMFPKVRKTKLDLRELGMRLAFRKTELARQLKA